MLQETDPLITSYVSMYDWVDKLFYSLVGCIGIKRNDYDDGYESDGYESGGIGYDSD